MLPNPDEKKNIWKKNRGITSYLQEQMELWSVERPGPVPGLPEREGR